jgi:hypothetical protein
VIAQQGGDPVIFDIPSWSSRAMLDSFGVGGSFISGGGSEADLAELAAFDYQFGSLDDSNNVVTNVWKGVL